MKTVTKYTQAKYNRVFAEVDPRNARSIKLLRRIGYFEPNPGKEVNRDWGSALVFEPKK
jgi:RimJ/RimL family protein N-acetyltransferase